VFFELKRKNVTELLSYVKDILLEYSMEHDADQAIEKDCKQIFNSIVVE